MKKIAFLAAVALAGIAITGSATADDALTATPGEVFYDEGSGVHRPGAAPVVVASVTLPAAGSYTIHADTDFEQMDRPAEASRARCDIKLPNEPNPNAGMQLANNVPGGWGALSFGVAVTMTQPGLVQLRCYQEFDQGPTLWFTHGRIMVQAVPKITRF
ncbi:hypothetical protein [Nonomuraea sp. NPDC050310]|uniref:hypothetical protein n=1 Tax=Nonomuraea sp. NPDC050310 TaxID=3154935 RepID=UPI0033F344FB